MNGEHPLVSVVVPTRNRAHLLPDLLSALERQDYPSYEVIVADDASDDGTAVILRDWAREGRHSVRLSAPSGSYAARNRGIEEARGSLVAFTDDDCLPEPRWLSALVAVMSDPALVGAQGVTLAGPGEITPFTHQIEARRPGPPYRTCNIMYRRSRLQQLGGFDSSLRWYADNILGFRALRLGGLAFAPDAVVRHPPRPREWRDRATWLARFRADRLHRRELRRLGAERVTLPGRVLPIVLWIVRPLLKQSVAHGCYLVRHPIRYVRGVRPMIREKRQMFLAMRDFALCRGGEGSTHRSLLPPLSEDPLVSIVVVTRDRPALLVGTLRALARQTWQRYELIVVDHGGDERTRLLVRREGGRYVPAPDSTLAWARQAGVSAAGGEIVAFTDDDCVPAADWLDRLVSAFRSDARLAGVQG
ncbi:MAG TPA: glycosyltransferase family A protein, partial [Chloroflexota bacterium]